MINLYDHQRKAVKQMKNGCILCGGVGSGKSRTSLAYYVEKVCQGYFPKNMDDSFRDMADPRDLYIITTAKKRDSGEWQKECAPFRIFENPDDSLGNVRLTIDSWNNIRKYQNVYGAFFIFDEQRVVGYGAWTKTFLKITSKNQWVLLSATPGDVWMDYCPVFIANGFYKNKTDFCNQHVRWSRHATFPKIEGYYNQGTLTKHRRDILITMEDQRETTRHEIVVPVEYDKELYKRVWKDRWDVYDDCPIRETGKLFYLLRRVVNADLDRVVALTKLLEEHHKTIVFYNFDYELEIIKAVLERMTIPYAEWNGHMHENLPTGDQWSYVVQYSAGCEGWNCVTTNVMVFYSQSYSYRTTEQAAGRIDRMNTTYRNLYYYKLRSHAPIDIAIKRALENKRNFNERSYLRQSKTAS